MNFHSNKLIMNKKVIIYTNIAKLIKELSIVVKDQLKNETSKLFSQIEKI